MSAQRLAQPASYLLAGGLVLAALLLHLIPALFAGLLVYTLIEALAPAVARLTSGPRARLLVGSLLGAAVVGAVVFGALALHAMLKNNGDSGMALLWERLAAVLEGANAVLPPALAAYLPESAEQLRSVAAAWLNTHGEAIRSLGKETGVAFVHVLVGGVIGAMVAVGNSGRPAARPLAQAWRQRVVAFQDAFARVFVGQGRISLINTACTGVFLYAVLPLLGHSLPLLKTMLAITLIAGLLPVIGNLISNSVIVLVAASVSFGAAVAALVFLVVLHKMEYFLGARIIGRSAGASAWEMLLAMLLCEAAFGLPGMAAAPVLYAWAKRELADAGLV